MEQETVLHIEGTVEQVLYRNEQNGYTVLDLDANGTLITVVGELGDVEEGEQLSVDGTYVNHIRFGVQFQAQYVERKLPEDAINIQRYLSSGVIKGIGSALAKKIVTAFGSQTLEIMEKQPTRLMEIRGISPKKCETIAQEVQKIFALRSLMLFLQQYNIRSRYAMRAYQCYGSGAKEMILANPYLLCGMGIELPFEKAELLADDLKVPKNAEQRILAGTCYILEHNTHNGYTCLPLDRLQPKVCEYLQVSESEFLAAYQAAQKEGNLVSYQKETREFVYLPAYYEAEQYIADRIGVLRDFSAPEDQEIYLDLIKREETEQGIQYAELQRKAILSALSRGLLILTGGPGTGKTTTLNGMISLFEKQGYQVMLAAPTGRAAQRMSDLTGYEAKTIHRLLEVEFDMAGATKFRHNESNPLTCDVMIVDEMSMVDVLLFESLLRALRFSCKLIMVGDSDQLPSVGAGNVLKDLIDSGQVPVVALNQIFRQAQQSCIVTNAHKIITGNYPDLQQKQSDFFFFQRLKTEDATQLILDLVKTRLPNAYHYHPMDDIQVITPSRKGLLGVIELNRRLQEVLNPPSRGKQEYKSVLYTFREGDKVMQIRNNYDLEWHKDGEPGAGIFNGDIGKILTLQKKTGEAVVCFEGRTAVYSFDQLEQLELAYAITVHKSQGCEFEVVILPLLGGFEKLYYRNLLYTAVTRSKKLLILIGSQQKIYQMVDNNRRCHRYTCLKHMMTEGTLHETDTSVPEQLPLSD